MLNDFQVGRVWENMLAAETRSLYFGDLASRYTRRKQWIAGLSFFLASGAAAAVFAKSPGWAPILMALIVSAMNAYSIATNLDRRIATMVRLHSTWNRIATDYDRLWNYTTGDGAEDELNRIIESEAAPSEIATTEAPNDQELLGKWQDRVFSMYHLSGQHE